MGAKNPLWRAVYARAQVHTRRVLRFALALRAVLRQNALW